MSAKLTPAACTSIRADRSPSALGGGTSARTTPSGPVNSLRMRARMTPLWRRPDGLVAFLDRDLVVPQDGGVADLGPVRVDRRHSDDRGADLIGRSRGRIG